MTDSEDEVSLLPSALDTERLEQMPVDGRVEAENGSWVALRYPPNPQKGWRWCEFSLIVNHESIPARGGPAEFKNLKALVAFLEQLEAQRLKGRR